jgi:predicted O-methyltransferase YrrM
MNIKYLNELKQIPHKYPWLTSLYALILQFKPKNIIEYGTEYGGTAMVMALALKQLQDEENHQGKIYTYDTFDVQSKGEIGSVPNLETAKQNLSQPLIKDFIEVDRGDFWEFCDRDKKDFDLLYFDIDNDGDKVLEMYNGCKDNIKKGSIVLFEGGSTVRDNVPWMIDLNKTKMTDVQDKVNYKLLTPDQKYSFSIIYNPEIYDLEI